MPFRRPSVPEVYGFISQTHYVEKVQLDTGTIEATMVGKSTNPHAVGHLRAITFAFDKLVDHSDFPTRKADIQTRYDSEESLFWLKEINSLMLKPLATDDRTREDENQVKSHQVGKWRFSAAANTFTNAPPPGLLPQIMHLWIKEAAQIHNAVKDRVDNPYGIAKDEFRRMNEFIEEIPYFFSCMQPFEAGNNKTGRLVANIFRLAWRLPWQFNIAGWYENFKEGLEKYQREKMQDRLKAARELKNFF